jgi:hypothetical protein
LVPTRAPATFSTELLFSAQFEASWGTFYDPSYSLCSGSDTSAVTIECDSGSQIRHVNPMDDAITCTEMQRNKLSCFLNASSVRNKFVSVNYVSDCC